MPLTPSKKLTVLEANIDDMNPEWYEPLMDRLFQSGALDVTLHPIIMKKGRPAVMVSVLTDKAKKESLANVLFEESTTLGVRSYEVERFETRRETKVVKTAHGPVTVKIGRNAGGKVINIAPEYESCRQLARKRHIPIKEVYQSAIKASTF